MKLKLLGVKWKGYARDLKRKEGISLTEEYRQALEDLNVKRAMYEIADKDYEEVAYHELKAAEARVEAIIKAAKEAM